MKIVVGLGNKGKKYEKTRHNVGFILLNMQSTSWRKEPKFDAEIYKKEDLLLVKPQTFMNESGKSVSKVLNFYKLEPKDLFVIHDDLDLPFGKVKKQFDAGPAGHRGVLSIIEELGTQKFWRIRVGVGRPDDNRIDPADFVLSDFSVVELQEIQAIDLSKLLY
jgi:PTH1 family peptidyl-tRNA hydrolase